MMSMIYLDILCRQILGEDAVMYSLSPLPIPLAAMPLGPKLFIPIVNDAITRCVACFHNYSCVAEQPLFCSMVRSDKSVQGGKIQ